MLFGTTSVWSPDWADPDAESSASVSISPGTLVEVDLSSLIHVGLAAPTPAPFRVEYLFSKKGSELAAIKYGWPCTSIWSKHAIQGPTHGILGGRPSPVQTRLEVSTAVGIRLLPPSNKRLSLKNSPVNPRLFIPARRVFHGEFGYLHKFVPSFWGSFLDNPDSGALLPLSCISSVLSNPTHETTSTTNTVVDLGESHIIETACMTISPCQQKKTRR